MSLLEKVEVFDKRTRGMRIHNAVSELTIHSIKKNEEKSGQVLMLVLRQVQKRPV